MKKTIALLTLLLAMISVGRSQTCHDCTPTQQKDKDAAAAREERAREIADHNKWPERPKLSPLFMPRQYAPFKVKLAVTNDTAKKIEQVTWECTLLDPVTRKTISTYRLVTKKRIAPHKDATLRERVMVPLLPFYGSKVVSANDPNPPKYELPDVVQAEQVNQIKEIKYVDGSVVHP